MTTKILITGASGFIGGHLVREALSRNMEVYAAVRASSDRKYLTDPRIRFFPFDMNDPAQVHKDLKTFYQEMGGLQYVVHNAAVTMPVDPAEFIAGNAEFTREFARMLMGTQHGMRKFVFMSSMAAIGPGNPESMTAIDEKHARMPVTPYGHSKLLAERYIHEIETLPYIIFRPTGVYGPGDAKFVLRLISLIKRGLEISIGPSDQKSSFVHAADLARLTLDACLSSIVREDFNIADGNFYTQKQLNSYLRKALGARTLRVRLPTPVVVASGRAAFHIARFTKQPLRLSHQKIREITSRNWKVDISKARTVLDFDPKYDLESGLRNVVESLE